MARKSKLRNSHKTTDFDDKFDAFLKESLSSEDSSLDTSRMAKYLDVKKKEQPWWMNEAEEDDGDDNDHGLTLTGKNFLKSRKELVGNVTKPQMERTPACEVHMSRDSLDGDSLHEKIMQKRDNTAGAFVPALSLESSQTYTDTLTIDKPEDNRRMGFETMAEQKEKDNFFQALEHESAKTVDYARLNQELDISSTVAVAKEGSGSQYKMADTETADTGPQGKSWPTSEHQNEQQKKQSMLSKVALLDSLDSTLGTKPAASREAKDDMQAIPEGVADQEGEEQEDVADGQMRGGTLTDDTDANRGTDTTNRGITLKTATGCNTDTSREIEALHQALRQVGDATLGSISKDFTFKDSSSKMFHETGGVTDGTHSTAAFAMKPVALPRGGRHDRTVDDVIMEVQQAKRQPELGQVSDMATIAMTTNSVLGKIEEENGGSTPKKPMGADSQCNGGVGLEMSPICNGGDSLDLSLLEKYDDNEGFGFDTSTPDRTTETRGKAAPSPAERTGGATSHTPDKKLQRYAHIKSSGYGTTSPAKLNHARVTWSTSEAAKQKPKSGLSEKSRSRSARSPARRPNCKVRTVTSETGKLGSVADSQLLQSFTYMLQEHLSSVGADEDNVIGSIKQLSVERVKTLMDEITKWQHQYHEQQKTTLELRANMEAMEQDFECRSDNMKTQYKEEISRLKQQNYVLTAKVEQLQKQLSWRALAGQASTEAGNEDSRLAGMEKELEEQEKLITGFQMENERLYVELKKLHVSSKEAESLMFSDNQKLRVDIAMLREELQRKDGQLRNKGLITGSEAQERIAAGLAAAEGTAVLGASRIAQLEVEVKQAKLREETYRREQQASGETKRQLELQVDELLRQVRDSEERTSHFASSQTLEAKEVEMCYKKEIERLNRKIQWYGENQQLLDRDVNALKEKDNEIRRLKVKIENLQSERGRKEAEVKAHTKQRFTEARRIQDLERQVKEMESIIRKRHPNSLPALMWAAAAAPEGETKKPPSVEFLEKRMRKLEEELEEKDGEAERSIRVLEQKYNVMKLQYEERIIEFESQLARCQHPEEGERPHTHSSALQRELDSVRERHKRKVGELEQEIGNLRKEVMVVKHRETASARAETKSSKEADSELQMKMKLLQQELTNQEREKQLLQRSVQRLMKEKEQLLTQCKNPVRPASAKDRPKAKQSKNGKKRGLGSREVVSEPEPLPAYMDMLARDKPYLPDTFAGQHVSEILHDNESLKLKVDRLQLELEHQRVYHQKLLAENESRERRIREEGDERMNALKSTHQMELNRLLTEHVMLNSASKVAELHSKLDTQEVVVRHLREQMASAEVDREKLATLRVRELALETQVNKLQEDLHDAKKCHTPEMRHLDGLRTKINEMEARHTQRERELQQLLTQSHMNADADLRHEVDKWRRIVEEKNRETETFRMELDAILDVLRELQRQGVVLPCRTLPGR